MTTNTKIKVFIADEQRELVEQYTRLINGSHDMEVVGQVYDGKALYDYYYFGESNNGVDVMLVDIGLPLMDGIAALGKIRAKNNKAPKALVITGLNGRNYPLEAIKNKANGFWAKINDSNTLLDAIREVHRGGDGFVYRPDPTDPVQPKVPPVPPPLLFEVYEEVLRKLIDGKKSKEIADEINYKLANVERIRRSLMHKFGANNPVELGYKAAQYGYYGESREKW
jgi:Response regulator containing a CheY-like receiver domain and an HTH DNA-binding domain